MRRRPSCTSRRLSTTVRITADITTARIGTTTAGIAAGVITKMTTTIDLRVRPSRPHSDPERMPPGAGDTANDAIMSAVAASDNDSA